MGSAMCVSTLLVVLAQLPSSAADAGTDAVPNLESDAGEHRPAADLASIDAGTIETDAPAPKPSHVPVPRSSERETVITATRNRSQVDEQPRAVSIVTPDELTLRSPR